MNRKILWSGLAIAVAATTIGAGAFATYVDSDTSAQVDVTAGTLKLEVGGSAATVDYDVANAYPGSDTGVGHGFVLQNTGTLPGNLHVYLVKDADAENGMVDPETDAPDTDPVGGEIDNWLKVNVDGNSFGYGGTVPSMGLDTLAVGGSEEITDLIWGPHPILIPAGDQYPAAPFELWFGWKISDDATNQIQSDSLSFHLEFVLEQA